MTTREKYRYILSRHFPEEAVDWVFGYLDRHHVHFHITRQRSSKLGDYRPPHPAMGDLKAHPYHEISINGDLPPYLFLWVFLHEAAHLETHLAHPPTVAPHGTEWQQQFRTLLMTHSALFPAEVQPLVARYTRRLPLSPTKGRAIEAELRRYMPGAAPQPAPLTLNNLAPGDTFSLVSQPTMVLQALERRRTRWLCLDTAGDRRYLVNGQAAVVQR